jgi:hypothetical protein
MAVSQMIALVALIEFALIAHLLSRELNKTRIRKAMTVTQVPSLLKQGYTMQDIYREAQRLHGEYLDTCNTVMMSRWIVFNPFTKKATNPSKVRYVCA